MLKAWPDRKNPPMSSKHNSVAMIGSRFCRSHQGGGTAGRRTHDCTNPRGITKKILATREPSSAWHIWLNLTSNCPRAFCDRIKWWDPQDRRVCNSSCWLEGGQHEWPHHIRRTYGTASSAVKEEGLSRHEAARRFRISPSSAIKWLQHYHKSGEKTARAGGDWRWILAAEISLPAFSKLKPR